VLGHRGAPRRARENTLEAFAAAREEGADGVELDVHRTADEALVVHHDAAVPGFGVLSDRRLDEIREAAPFVPTLGEVLDECHGMLVNIEVKNLPGDEDYDAADRAARLTVELLQARDHADRVVVSSFNIASVDCVRSLDPSIPTGFLAFGPFAAGEALDVAHAHGHGALHPFKDALLGPDGDAFARRARDLGVALNVWTVNDPDEIGRLAELGVASIISDVPGEARAAVRARRA
jgi:glycerophosphoryl diester phosphodiesterase